VHAGFKASSFTAADVLEILYAGMADNTKFASIIDSAQSWTSHPKTCVPIRTRWYGS